MVALGGAIGAIASAKAASKQMAFQKEAYRHRYQWTMEDMRLAGLNPMLAASLGGGGAPPGAALSVGSVGDLTGSALGALRSSREERMQNITRATAKTNAKVAEEILRIQTHNADIRGYEADISKRDRDIGTSAQGIAAAKGRLIPGSLLGGGSFIGERLGTLLGTQIRKRKGKAYPKYRKGYGKTRDIFGRY